MLDEVVTAGHDCEVVWSADMNWDRSRNNHFSRTAAAALDRIGLTTAWDGRDVDRTHTHTDGISTSTIDHFLVSHRLKGLITDCKPLHTGDNLSRHSPILLSLRLGELPRREAEAQPQPRRMPHWDRATPAETGEPTPQPYKGGYRRYSAQRSY